MKLKKIATISLLLIFLCANTELGQLLKLPALLHHYTEHHEDDAGLSFAGFLHKHYKEERSYPSPDNDHQNLPFKTTDFGFLQISLALQTPVTFETEIEKPLIYKANFAYCEVFYASSTLSRIWQPPKSC